MSGDEKRPLGKILLQRKLVSQQDLDKAGVPNEMVTVPGGHHGQWTPEENERVQRASLEFLQKHGVIP